MKSRSVSVSISEENSPDTEIWLFRIMERIVLDQLNIDPILKGELLYCNQQQIKNFINYIEKDDEE